MNCIIPTILSLFLNLLLFPLSFHSDFSSTNVLICIIKSYQSVGQASFPTSVSKTFFVMLSAYSLLDEIQKLINLKKTIIILIGILYKLDTHLKKEDFFIKSSLATGSNLVSSFIRICCCILPKLSIFKSISIHLKIRKSFSNFWQYPHFPNYLCTYFILIKMLEQEFSIQAAHQNCV